VYVCVCIACPSYCSKCSQSGGVISCDEKKCDVGYARAPDGTCQSKNNCFQLPTLYSNVTIQPHRTQLTSLTTPRNFHNTPKTHRFLTKLKKKKKISHTPSRSVAWELIPFEAL